MARFGVSYFGIRDPRHANADLDEIAEAGFQAVTHTFSEHDLRYHEADVARLVEETRKRGLEASLDPWGVAGLFGGEAYPEIALTHPEARQVDAEGHPVPAACPCAPATRELLSRWTRTAVSFGPDILFWDEPHWYLGALRPGPSAPCCRCVHCAERWRERTGETTLPAEGASELTTFRNDCLRDVLERAIREAGDAVRHSLCLLPRGEFARAGSDEWESFASLPGLSRLATDPYWMDRPVVPAEFVRPHAETLRRVCTERRLEMEVWLQGIRLPAGRESDLAAATDVAIECGAERIAYWSYRGTAGMSWLACEDPEAAWQTMCSAVRRHGGTP
ncbi:MAG: hypothetical protein R3B81_17605 [bacterium]